MSSFWLFVWAGTLSCGWLLPNHYPPWSAFHADAWVALAMAAASAAVIFRSKIAGVWQGTTIFVMGLAWVPWVQYSVGLIPFAGQAWTSTAYLLGFLLAMLTGQRWEKIQPGQLVDGLFFAVGVASIVSVSLQLNTWLGLMDTGIFDLWSMGLTGGRPYANLGQPNQLATLLLWGLLACAWAFHQQKIRAPAAILMAAYLLLGIALTQSRTAWLGLTFILFATWIWKRLWRTRGVCWGVTGLYAFFWVYPALLKWIVSVLLLEGDYIRAQLSDEPRALAWRLLIRASLERPWFGYGWSEIGHAQLAMASDFPALHMKFGHAHNLFLDLILWLGWPMGILVSVVLIWWFVARLRATKNARDALLCMFLGVVGIHAMLELPLHYAYFLLPVGMVMGVLNERMSGHIKVQLPRWTLVVVWVASAVLLGGIIRDYFRVEASFQTLRFELAHIGNLPAGKPPEVILLTQLRERIRLMRYEVRAEMSQEELAWMLNVVNAFPDGAVLYKAATALALNNRPDEAQQWLKKICKITSSDECDLIRRVWIQDMQVNQRIAAVSWPE